MNASTTRDNRRAQLAADAEGLLLFARAVDELADLIETSSAPVCAYTPIWTNVATRLRRDAGDARVGAQHASDRLADIAAADEAAQRWIPHR